MSVSDLINGAYEAFGGVMIILNVLRLVKDKSVKGVNVWTTVFFTSWGYWNAFWYYPHLHQWLSFTGGLVIVAANTVWVSLAVYYARRAARAERSLLR